VGDQGSLGEEGDTRNKIKQTGARASRSGFQRDKMETLQEKKGFRAGTQEEGIIRDCVIAGVAHGNGAGKKTGRKLNEHLCGGNDKKRKNDRQIPWRKSFRKVKMRRTDRNGWVKSKQTPRCKYH